MECNKEKTVGTKRKNESSEKVSQQITEKLLSLGSILKHLSITPSGLNINTV